MATQKDRHQYRTSTSRDCAEGLLDDDVCEVQAELDRQSARIEDGSCYAGHKQSTWHRGKSPSDYDR